MERTMELRGLRALASLVVALALVCLLAFSGCDSAAKAVLSESVSGDTATAMVEQVDGNTVTVRLMDGEQPGQGGPGGGGQGGAPGAQPGTGSDDANSASGSDSSSDVDNDSNNSSDSSQAPEPPSGDNGSAPGGNPPSNGQGAPDGQGGPGGTEATLTISDESIIYTSEGETETQGSLSDITQGSMLTLSVSNGTDVTKIVVGQGMGGQGGQGGPGQGSDTVNNGTGATTYDSDESTDGESYTSSASDENAVRVENGAEVTLAAATVTKSGESTSSEDSDFYGLNAGVLAYDGSSLTVKGGTVDTDSSGSNGIFAYGEGTSVTVSDTVIRTTQGNSGGIEVSGGATLTAQNLDIDTQGQSSAAIRSDRGGGTETVTGGTYTTHGTNSPAVYSTADVTVKDAELTAENTEGVVIEGKNSVTLEDCDVTGNVNGNATRSGVVNNVMIYQSMSGDADEGTGSFTMNGGTFTATNGTLFYVTNTDATIDLTGVEIKNSGDSLMTIAGNDGVWGNSGSNGATVAFTASEQELEGDITVDEESSLTLKLDAKSSYEGAINSDGAAGSVDVELASGATWTLTGDSYVSSVDGDTDGIDLNGHTLYVDGKAWTK